MPSKICIQYKRDQKRPGRNTYSCSLGKRIFFTFRSVHHLKNPFITISLTTTVCYFPFCLEVFILPFFLLVLMYLHKVL